MSRFFILVVLLLLPTCLLAQFVEKSLLYVSQELNFGNYLGHNLNLNYLYDNKYSVQIGYSGHIRNAASKPQDYSEGLVLGFLFFGLAEPYDNLETYQLMPGRIVKLNDKGTLRLNLSAGLGYTKVTEPVNWEPSSEGQILLPNYTYDFRTTKVFSLIVNPKLEFPFTRIYGLTLSPMMQISKESLFVGIGLGHMLGLLRKKL